MDTRHVIEECARTAHDGTRSFGEVVRTLLDAGVEGYQVDYRARSATYYSPSGESVTVALHTPDGIIPEQFDSSALQEAIRGSQRGEVRYPEFVARSMNAGCLGYHVFFRGRHVLYLGRDGSQHVEHFPS